MPGVLHYRGRVRQLPLHRSVVYGLPPTCLGDRPLSLCQHLLEGLTHLPQTRWHLDDQIRHSWHATTRFLAIEPQSFLTDSAGKVQHGSHNPYRYCRDDGRFVHIIEASDLRHLLTHTTTPREFLDFLDFRERKLTGEASSANDLSEKQMFGWFVDPSGANAPEELVDALNRDLEEVDIHDFIETASQGVKAAKKTLRDLRQRFFGELVWLDRADWRSFRAHLNDARGYVLPDQACATFFPLICGDGIGPDDPIKKEWPTLLFGVVKEGDLSPALRETLGYYAEAAAEKYGSYRVLLIAFGRRPDQPAPLLLAIHWGLPEHAGRLKEFKRHLPRMKASKTHGYRVDPPAST